MATMSETDLLKRLLAREGFTMIETHLDSHDLSLHVTAMFPGADMVRGYGYNLSTREGMAAAVDNMVERALAKMAA